MFLYDLPRADEDSGLVDSYPGELWTHLNENHSQPFCVLGLDTGLAPRGKKPLQSFVPEATDHLNEFNPTGYIIKELTLLIQLAESPAMLRRDLKLSSPRPNQTEGVTFLLPSDGLRVI